MSTFWHSQPVIKDINLPQEGPLEPDKNPEDIPRDPVPLPKGLVWSNVDILDDKEANELYSFLRDNYVEDSDGDLRFSYSVPLLRWALTYPGYKKEWWVGIRSTSNNKLVGFISAIPQTLNLRDIQKRVTEINFLCCDKKIRSKGVTPILIKEITRLSHQDGIFQALYTVGKVITRPIATVEYTHRLLKPKRLLDFNFSSLSRNMTMNMFIKMNRILPISPLTKKFRPMEVMDVNAVTRGINRYNRRFSLSVYFTEQEVSHMLLPREGVVYTYVISNEDNDVTDMISFYRIDSTVLKKNDTLKAAYLYYYYNSSLTVDELINYAVSKANDLGFDVMNALTMGEHKDLLDKLKFRPGTGQLHYYLYNWVMNIKNTEFNVLLI